MTRKDNLDIIANISQLFSLLLLTKDATNSDLLNELQKQDRVYLEKISKDLDLIKKKLEINDG